MILFDIVKIVLPTPINFSTLTEERVQMPKMEIVPIAEIKGTAGMSEARRKKLEVYVGYISQLTDEKGGRLVCFANENILTVRNDLKKAAEMAGKNIKTRRSGNIIAFYLVKKRGRKKTGS
jgi:hypothetical protein